MRLPQYSVQPVLATTFPRIIYTLGEIVAHRNHTTSRHAPLNAVQYAHDSKQPKYRLLPVKQIMYFGLRSTCLWRMFRSA